MCSQVAQCHALNFLVPKEQEICRVFISPDIIKNELTDQCQISCIRVNTKNLISAQPNIHLGEKTSGFIISTEDGFWYRNPDLCSCRPRPETYLGIDIINSTWRFPVIFDFKWNMNKAASRSVVFTNVIEVKHKTLSNVLIDPGSITACNNRIKICPLDFTRNTEHLFHMSGVYISRVSQRISKPSDKSGSNGSDNDSVVVKKFSDMPEDDRRNVICGALFCAGIFILLAYIAIDVTKRGIPPYNKSPSTQKNSSKKKFLLLVQHSLTASPKMSAFSRLL